MSEAIDLSAFPILRLDQISIIDTECLIKSVKEVEQIIQQGENDNPSMYRYLVKQFDQMRKEILSREALERVNNLLTGMEDPLNRKTVSSITLIETPREVKPRRRKSEPEGEGQVKNTTKEEKVSHFVPSSSRSLKEKGNTVVETTQPTLSAENLNMNSPPLTKVLPNIEPVQLSQKVEDQFSRSDPHEHHTPRSVMSSHSNRSSRKSQPITEVDDQPSKKSLEVVYKNFGNEFIVAATTKKKRFYPTKKNTETMEEVKNRERLERRKFAMQRLLQRKEEREMQIQKIREKKRLERAEQAKSEANMKQADRTQRSPKNGDSSDSESVSGGDDDYDKIEISEKMVEAAKDIIVNQEDRVNEGESSFVANNEEIQPDGSILREGEKVVDQAKTSEDIPAIQNEMNQNISSIQQVSSNGSVRRDTSKVNQTRSKTLLSSRSKSSIEKETKISDKEENTNRRKTVHYIENVSKQVPSSSAKKASVIRPGKLIKEEDIQKLEEVSEVNFGEDPIVDSELAAKNLAALATIRKLKELKLARAKGGISNEEKLGASLESGQKENKYDAKVESVFPEPSSKDNEDHGKHVDQIPLNEERPSSAVLEKASKEEEILMETKHVDQKEYVMFHDTHEQKLDSMNNPSFETQEKEIGDGTKEIAFNKSEGNSVNDEQNTEDEDDSDDIKDLFLYENGSFIANYDPEELPGLISWKLEKVQGLNHDWRIDLSRYLPIKDGEDSEKSDVFRYRSTKRRNIPSGLILIAVECQDLLLGLTDVGDNDSFLSAWIQRVHSFDANASSYDEGEEKLLFTNQSICGNGYMICKKVEDLIKDVFIRLSATIPPVPQLVVPSTDATRSYLISQGSIVSRLKTELKEIPFQENIAVELEQNLVETRQNHVSEEVEGDAVDFLQSENLENQNRERGENGTVNFDDQLQGNYDSDKVLLPTSGLVPSSDNKSKLGLNKGRRANKTAVPKVITNAKRSLQPLENSKNGANLIEFYPNFGMIFPVAYHHIGNRDDNSSARVLIESMHIQAKLYQEWIDVMRDYSTVFWSEDMEDNAKAIERSSEVYSGNSRTLHFRVKSSRSEVTNIVTDVLTNELTNWVQLPTGLGLGLSWNLLWTWSKPHLNKEHLVIWQKVNHFDDSKQLTRKDLLKKNLQRFTDMKEMNKYAGEFEIMPQTYLLPHEYTQFVASFKEFESMKSSTTASEEGKAKMEPEFHNYWILKPVGLSRGRGISLIKNLAEVVYSQSSVIQKYVERPLLCLNHYKFDLRLFIVVTSFKPLEAFIYRDGFARVSTHQYSLNPNDTVNKFIHLTNSSIQKQNANGPTEDNPINDKEDDPDAGGSKIALLGSNGLWKRLEQYGKINTEQLWSSICLLVVKSLVAVDDKMIFQPNCFELFGYDILLDETLRPWLLEVNASPSLARENALDKRIKNAMLKDLVNLLDVAPFDRAALSRIISRRLSQMSKNRNLMGRNDAELEKDLKDILGDYIPRKYGELPKNMGNFERLAPETSHHQYVIKLKKKIVRTADDNSAT